MKKKVLISSLFLLFALILYWVAVVATKAEIQGGMSNENGTVINGLIAVTYAMTGMASYFLTINTAAFAGLFVSWWLKDKDAVNTFKVLSALSFVTTIFFYIFLH